MSKILEAYETAVINADWSAVEKILNCPKNAAMIDVNREIGTDRLLALHTAVSQGVDHRFVQLLLDLGADINAINAFGNTPLHKAIFAQDYGSVELLLRRGADPNRQSSRVGSSFHVLCCCGGIEMVDALLQHGADPSLKDAHGYNPLHLAAANGQVELLKKILEMKAIDVNATTDDVTTAMHLALNLRDIDYHHVKVEIIKLLIQHGADINVLDARQRTPLRVANRFSNNKYADCLLKHAALLAAQNRHVCEANMNLIESDDRLMTVFLAFQEQLLQMKETKIHEAAADATYFDVLTKRGRPLALVLRNKNVSHGFSFKKCRKLFSSYAEDLQECYRRGQQELIRRQNFVRVLQNTIGLFLKNDDIIYMISEYYNDEEFSVCCDGF